jgi:pimeloyl-ACP methyl ester carboxylesterase
MNSTARADSPEKQKNRDKAIAVAKQNHRSFIRHAIPMLFRPKHRRLMKDTVNEVKKEALRTSKQGAIAAIEGMKIRPDREVLLHFAPYRVLFIAGKNDPVIPFEFSQEQMKAPQVTGLVTENGHMGYLEDADVVIPAVKKFVRECV